MFQLNEAPNQALAALNSTKTARSCGMFWSILCCLPTLGLTTGCIGVSEEDHWGSCCFPHPMSVESKITLSRLVGKLNEIRAPRGALERNSDIDENAFIEWQVKETMNLLQHAMDENIIKKSYRATIDQVLIKIRTKAQQEQRFDHVLNIEKSPICVQNFGS